MNNNIAIDGSPDDNNEPPAQQRLRTVPLQSREQVTTQQISILVQSAMALSHLLLPPVDESTGESLRSQNSEVSIAAENTIVGMCHKLDEIIADEDRFTLANQRCLEQQLAEVYAGHIDIMAQQRATLASMNLPSRTVKIELIYIREAGEWVCIMAEGSSREELIGRGKYPADAIADFDKKFLGTKNEQPNTAIPTVDTEGNSSTSSKPPRRRRMGGNRSRPGPDAEGV